MTTLSLDEFGIRSVSHIKNDVNEVLLIDPLEPATVVSQLETLGKNRLRGNHFAELSYLTARFRNQVRQILTNGGLIAVVLRRFTQIAHASHPDLRISNYDWLWSGAGRDSRLYINDSEQIPFTCSDYANDGPFLEYLQQPLVIDAVAKGDLRALASDREGNAVAFVLLQNQGKLFFLPRPANENGKMVLKDALENAVLPEYWPSSTTERNTNLPWIEDYQLPEIKFAEQILKHKEEDIVRLEQECEYIHRNILQLKQLHSNFFTGNAGKLANALFSLLSQWGVDLILEGNIIHMRSGNSKGIILTEVCSQEAPVWMAKKLLRLTPESHKSILAVNAHREIEPGKRPRDSYSPTLIKFAEKHNIALISAWDIFRAHCLKRKELINLLWTQQGVVAPKWLQE